MNYSIQNKQLLLIATALSVATVNAAAGGADLAGLQSRIVGEWTSISCEIRPSPNQSNPEGSPVPTYLTRNFTYGEDGSFLASITVYADNSCSLPAITYDFAGELVWHGPNPAVAGAWSQDYILNKALSLTVKAPPMLEQLNALPAGACGDAPYELNKPQDILGKPCVLLKFVEGSEYVIDHDFLYVREDTPHMLFMGGKHVDGGGFYFPENRPVVGLQQPLIKVQ